MLTRGKNIFCKAKETEHGYTQKGPNEMNGSTLINIS